jgi:NTF2 fold immunity protein
MIRPVALVLLAVLSIGISTGGQAKHGVRDEAEAIRIAVAAWQPIYGAAHIAAEKPYHASLNRGIWTVTGSLPKGFNTGGRRRRDFRGRW